jgi:hypothetical protein
MTIYHSAGNVLHSLGNREQLSVISGQLSVIQSLTTDTLTTDTLTTDTLTTDTLTTDYYPYLR